ncbi:MAG TPA: sigma-54 dependent transcriptional regulator [bacterium]|jgi:NtrC-family two-component system response regulator AlgB|nr:sigma-54 dependent transcriptional regulator [bacterium]
MERSASSILVVDDEATIRRTLAICLNGAAYNIREASSPKEALAEAGKHYFEAAFVDLRLGTQSGMDLIPALVEANAGIRIVVITAYATIDSAVEAIKRGAFDYLPKPFTPEQVLLMAKHALHARTEATRIAELAQPGREMDLESGSPAVLKATELARQAAPSAATILIRGETGTGKGVLARAIHAWSPRRDHPFAVVSCPAIPTELLESELFGHIQGSFTGAHRDQVGRVAQAQKGTLFLDEIGDLPLALQAKMLRFIQDHEYERVGEAVTRKADVRVLAATHVDLEAAVRAGRFREDLLYRLNVIEIRLPSLRERPEDIMPLALRMLLRFAAENRRNITGFTSAAQDWLASHDWPGNLRELSNAMERAAILTQGPLVSLDLIGPAVQAAERTPSGIGSDITLDKLEEQHIRRVLATDKPLEVCARILGIDVVTLWRKRKKYGLLETAHGQP